MDTQRTEFDFQHCYLLRCAHTSSGVHSASYRTGTSELSPEGKEGPMKLDAHLQLVPR
jgi:hypothetical protein